MLICKRLNEWKSSGIRREDGKGKIKKRNIVIIIKSVLTVELRWFQSWLLTRILYMNEKIREYLEIQKIKKIIVQKLQSKGIKLYTIHSEKRKEVSLPWYSEESITWFI